MKHITMSLVALLMSVAFVSCDNDDPNSESIFKTETKNETEFDKWLNTNFVEPYNIKLYYLYNDKLTDNYYNVVPATITNSKAMAKMIKHVWLDAYVEACGEDFLKANAFRVFQFIGSPEFDSQGSIVLGTAEGGIQVTLFRLNELDLNNIYVNQDEPFRAHAKLPLDLNYWYFHTMHHEFCHILTQKKYYSTDFQTISAGKYHSTDWINVEDEDAVKEGFVTGYASGEYNEDFAEVYANYVTSNDESWKARLDKGIQYHFEGIDSKGGKIEEKVDNANVSGMRFWGYPSWSDLAAAGFYAITYTGLDKDGKSISVNARGFLSGKKLAELGFVELTSPSVSSTAGADIINAKLEIVRSYLQDSWGIDLEKLRAIVLRRSAEVMNMDLTTLN